jgi:hypothetical protein
VLPNCKLSLAKSVSTVVIATASTGAVEAFEFGHKSIAKLTTPQMTIEVHQYKKFENEAR